MGADKKASVEKIIEAGSWEAAAVALKPNCMLSVLKFGDGWKAMYGQFDYVGSHGYLQSCSPRKTVELACLDLIFRDRVVDGLDIHDESEIWRALDHARFNKVKKETVASLKQAGWGNPLTDEQTQVYDTVIMHLSIAMGAY